MLKRDVIFYTPHQEGSEFNQPPLDIFYDPPPIHQSTRMRNERMRNKLEKDRGWQADGRHLAVKRARHGVQRSVREACLVTCKPALHRTGACQHTHGTRTHMAPAHTAVWY